MRGPLSRGPPKSPYDRSSRGWRQDRLEGRRGEAGLRLLL